MPMLDVFNSDEFSVAELTESINKLPYVPGRLGKTGWFKKNGQRSLTAIIEEKLGKLMLVPTAARGTMPNVMGGKDRRMKAFLIPHIPLNAAVMADDVQGMRAFGSETEVESVSELVNEKLADMKQNLEVTVEWHRVGALKGNVLDADATSVIYNWFDEFGLTEQEYDFDFSTDNQIKLNAAALIRYVGDSLGATPFTTIRAFCGQGFFDHLITCDEVKEAFDRYQDSSFFREQQARGENGFPYAGVTWEEFRGQVGNVKFIDDDECRFVPEGVTGLFSETYAPAEFIETVNTTGKPYYAKQERMKFDVGVELHAQTNPLVYCTRPAVLVKGNDTSGS